MDIAKVRIDALHRLTIENCLQAEYTMGSGVLRTDINHIVIRTEEAVLLRLEVTILVDIELQAVVRLYIILESLTVVVFPVLAERIPLEIAAQEETTHIGMTQEHDTVEVVNLALQQIGYTPDIRNGGKIG